MKVLSGQSPQSVSPRPLKVALVGECMIEMRGEPALGFSQTFGGDTLNAAVYLSRLNPCSRIVADYITAIGADSFSDAMRQLWRDEGVGDQHVRVIEGALPGLYFIQTDTQGERRFLYWRGEAAARSMFDGVDAGAVLHALAHYDYIYLSGISLAILTANGRQRLMQALHLARESGTRIVFDNNYRAHLWPDAPTARQAYEDMLRLTDLALITWEDDAALFGYTDVEALFRAYAHFGVAEVALKRGVASCLVQCALGRFEVPAEQVGRIIDTTAAGDSFSAAYLSCRLQGGDPQLAARWGHRLAAEVVQHRGALIPSAAMPSLDMPSFICAAEA
ncbi:sugar kinase [Pseudomonas typographi]|uniref:Sugar kinase n=1 Tax=Pseudomonas typographi TaxID=2715964 RepID=A0ABR7Z3D8_9PSED|nr:sugar kinase [Pseudomonas typographi]MBD1586504.1 sugar kinase [Pseudomonas typographi]MBD1600005.1 sugar kinase [Pseudomonas typographi]